MTLCQPQPPPAHIGPTKLTPTRFPDRAADTGAQAAEKPGSFDEFQHGVGGQPDRDQGEAARCLIQSFLQVPNQRELVDVDADGAERRQVPVLRGLNGVVGVSELQHRPDREAHQNGADEPFDGSAAS